MTCLIECLNDGKCVFYMGRYMCNCRTGYTGDACQVRYNKLSGAILTAIKMINYSDACIWRGFIICVRQRLENEFRWATSKNFTLSTEPFYNIANCFHFYNYWYHLDKKTRQKIYKIEKDEVNKFQVSGKTCRKINLKDELK